MYKYGEKILVRDEDENIWVERIFIAMSDQKEAICAHGLTGGSLLCYFWREHKPITKKKVIPYTLETFPLDNSGMVRGKDCFATILEVDRYGVKFCMDGAIKGFLYAKLAEHYEWLNKDGTTKPFGVEVDNESQAK